MFALKREPVVDNQNREQARRTYSACGCPLDHLGAYPKCLVPQVETAQMLRVKRQDQDLFRQIDRIVARHW